MHPLRDRFALLAAASLLGTLLLGVTLRAFLAGVPLPWGEYRALRHAHSHLGYYGVLFPLAWWAAARIGAPVPGPRTTALYALAVLVGSGGFAVAGYGRVAIVGSTTVLAIWLSWAWQLRGHALSRSWLSSAPWSVLAAAVAIPAVAVLTSRAPELARELVQGFLTVLMFGVVAPLALALERAPPPPPGLWLLTTLGAALVLGPLPGLLPHLSLALLGALVATAGWRAAAPLEIRLLWVGLGVALLALGTRLLPEHHAVAIAGVHFAVLGPLLLALGRPLFGALPRPARLTYIGLLLAFTAAVGVQAWWMTTPITRLAAALGLALAAMWVLLAARHRVPSG